MLSPKHFSRLCLSFLFTSPTPDGRFAHFVYSRVRFNFTIDEILRFGLSLSAQRVCKFNEFYLFTAALCFFFFDHSIDLCAIESRSL